MNVISTLSVKYPNLKVVSVTKNRNLSEVLLMLSESGLTRIAENRLEEALEKFPKLPKVEKHFIGKLQSRKIKKIVENFDVIQSVESLEQAKKISSCGKKIKIMLEINISGKENRSGAKPQEVEKLIPEIGKLPNIELIGVMGIASRENPREEFKLLKSLQGNLPECSMGMSEDYEIAIEEGSTMLRLGRILFGNVSK